MKLNEYQRKTVMTADGRRWCQRCFVCDKIVDFIRDATDSWIRVSDLVRHKKCFPGIPT